MKFYLKIINKNFHLKSLMIRIKKKNDSIINQLKINKIRAISNNSKKPYNLEKIVNFQLFKLSK